MHHTSRRLREPVDEFPWQTGIVLRASEPVSTRRLNVKQAGLESTGVMPNCIDLTAFVIDVIAARLWLSYAVFARNQIGFRVINVKFVGLLGRIAQFNRSEVVFVGMTNA